MVVVIVVVLVVILVIVIVVIVIVVIVTVLMVVVLSSVDYFIKFSLFLITVIAVKGKYRISSKKNLMQHGTAS